MGIYLNPGNDLFQENLNSEIYVDKSMLIAHTNKVLRTQQKFLCVSRPRRFGKSMAAQMLAAYYDRSVDSRDQFDGLAISEHPSFDEHLNKYNVIQLNMHNFLTPTNSMDEMLGLLEEDLKDDLIEEYPDINISKGRNLATALLKVHAKTKVPFVFIIDEWDCIFRVHQEDEKTQKKYLDYLRNLLKDQPYVALAYMTGILPVKKYGQHSALNMFTEVSMTDAREFAPLTGFTRGEVEELCESYEMPFEDIQAWYDGYNVDGVETYNPRSVVMSVTGHRLNNYWTQTETFEALKVYIEMDFDGLKEKVVQMIAGERIPIETRTFQNDMRSLTSADDVLTLLIHLGYLTYDFETSEVWIPNNELQEEFYICIKDRGWEVIMDDIKASDELMKSMIAGEEDKVAAAVEGAHDRFSSIFAYNDENTLASVLVLAFYAARKSYIMHREYATGKGYADLVFLPRPNKDLPALVMELKVNEATDTAIDQIKQRNYPLIPAEYAGEIILCGISYDKESKAHSCKIERM